MLNLAELQYMLNLSGLGGSRGPGGSHGPGGLHGPGGPRGPGHRGDWL